MAVCNASVAVSGAEWGGTSILLDLNSGGGLRGEGFYFIPFAWQKVFKTWDMMAIVRHSVCRDSIEAKYVLADSRRSAVACGEFRESYKLHKPNLSTMVRRWEGTESETKRWLVGPLPGSCWIWWVCWAFLTRDSMSHVTTAKTQDAGRMVSWRVPPWKLSGWRGSLISVWTVGESEGEVTITPSEPDSIWNAYLYKCRPAVSAGG